MYSWPRTEKSDLWFIFKRPASLICEELDRPLGGEEEEEEEEKEKEEEEKEEKEEEQADNNKDKEKEKDRDVDAVERRRIRGTKHCISCIFFSCDRACIRLLSLTPCETEYSFPGPNTQVPKQTNRNGRSL